jgi:hypothetical protein
MFDIKEVVVNRLKTIARNSPYFACNLIKNMILNTVKKGSSIAIRFPIIQNMCDFVGELREFYLLKKYGLIVLIYVLFIKNFLFKKILKYFF